jgi:hypothetical protein
LKILQKNINEWKISKISQTQIYQKSKYDIFKIDLQLKLKKEIFSLQNLLRPFNSSPKNPCKNT